MRRTAKIPETVILIGACYHDVTNGRLMRNKLGQYLTIIKQRTKNWPSGDLITGEIIESKIKKPKNKRPWVDQYMNVSR